MTARKRPARRASPLASFRASVVVERNGASVRVEDVPADQAFNVLAEMLLALRAGQAAFPELLAELQPVGGYSPVPVDESEYGGSAAKRVGF